MATDRLEMANLCEGSPVGLICSLCPSQPSGVSSLCRCLYSVSATNCRNSDTETSRSLSQNSDTHCLPVRISKRVVSADKRSLRDAEQRHAHELDEVLLELPLARAAVAERAALGTFLAAF